MKQKLRSAPSLYSNIPLEVTFKNANWNEETHSFIMNGANNSFQFTTSFIPTLSFLNGTDKISQAVTAETQVLSSTGTKNFNYAFFRTTVNNISDSAYIKVEHNWVSPDPFIDNSKNFLYDLSTERYWNISGILPSTFDAKIQLKYNGKNVSSGNLDNLLTNTAGFNEDSLVLFHRNNPSEDWEVVNNCTFNSQGSKTDGSGRVDVNEFKLGQYSFGWKRGYVGVNENATNSSLLSIHPSLAQDQVLLKTSTNKNDLTFSIIDMSGKLILNSTITEAKTINIENLNQGTYIVVLSQKGKTIDRKEFIKL